MQAIFFRKTILSKLSTNYYIKFTKSAASLSYTYTHTCTSVCVRLKSTTNCNRSSITATLGKNQIHAECCTASSTKSQINIMVTPHWIASFQLASKYCMLKLMHTLKKVGERGNEVSALFPNQYFSVVYKFNVHVHQSVENKTTFVCTKLHGGQHFTKSGFCYIKHIQNAHG
jgi:hypothetical protein